MALHDPPKNATECRSPAGHAYSIIMWYAFDGLDFELTTSLKPE